MFRSIVKGVARQQAWQLATRSFAAEAAAAEIKVPAAAYGPAGKYASALYVSAVKSKSLEAVESELKKLVELVKTSQTFSQFLRDPSVTKETRIKAIEEVFGEAQFSALTKNLLAVLADNGRLSQLPKIAQSYEAILMAHRGQVQATVTSALELTQAELSELKQALATFLMPGQTLQLTEKVDRSIIGGLTVDIGEKHIDLSIRSRINKMEKVLAEME